MGDQKHLEELAQFIREHRGNEQHFDALFSKLQAETEAEQSFRAAVQSDPSHAEAHYGLGLIFRKNKRLADARREFEASLQSDPWKSQTYGNLGMVCLSQGDFDCAEKQFIEALRLNPADALAGEGLRQVRNARFERVK